MTTRESGFSFIDVMIAVSILLVGVLALGAALTIAIARAQESEEQIRAKQIATTTAESIFAARDIQTQSLGWSAIRNGTGIPDAQGVGSFLTGFQPVYDGPGQDGIVGTADDSRGPDGIAGNADDHRLIDGYTRQIQITSLPDDVGFNPPRDNFKQVVVTINYSVNNAPRSVDVTTFIALYQFS